jgi:hypothetical protein
MTNGLEYTAEKSATKHMRSLHVIVTSVLCLVLSALLVVELGGCQVGPDYGALIKQKLEQKYPGKTFDVTVETEPGGLLNSSPSTAIAHLENNPRIAFSIDYSAGESGKFEYDYDNFNETYYEDLVADETTEYVKKRGIKASAFVSFYQGDTTGTDHLSKSLDSYLKEAEPTDCMVNLNVIKSEAQKKNFVQVLENVSQMLAKKVNLPIYIYVYIVNISQSQYDKKIGKWLKEPPGYSDQEFTKKECSCIFTYRLKSGKTNLSENQIRRYLKEGHKDDLYG